MMESYNDNLHKGATGKLYEYSRELRKGATEAEKKLWDKLRNRKLVGLKFRRQHPLDKFIADFYCHEKRLVIEIDGEVHDNLRAKENDTGRTYDLKELGITVIRFRNEEVINDIEKVVKKIADTALIIAEKADDKKNGK
ncbi:MAG: endonuclease domain-containing protein [Chitinophagaceae bacterium]|nr:endonuclease domain-containing protein [Chitinophagaceae bacterium]